MAGLTRRAAMGAMAGGLASASLPATPLVEFDDIEVLTPSLPQKVNDSEPPMLPSKEDVILCGITAKLAIGKEITERERSILTEYAKNAPWVTE